MIATDSRIDGLTDLLKAGAISFALGDDLFGPRIDWHLSKRSGVALVLIDPTAPLAVQFEDLMCDGDIVMIRGVSRAEERGCEEHRWRLDEQIRENEARDRMTSAWCDRILGAMEDAIYIYTNGNGYGLSYPVMRNMLHGDHGADYWLACRSAFAFASKPYRQRIPGRRRSRWAVGDMGWI